jgi:hypothetical protein
VLRIAREQRVDARVVLFHVAVAHEQDEPPGAGTLRQQRAVRCPQGLQVRAGEGILGGGAQYPLHTVARGERSEPQRVRDEFRDADPAHRDQQGNGDAAGRPQRADRPLDVAVREHRQQEGEGERAECVEDRDARAIDDAHDTEQRPVPEVERIAQVRVGAARLTRSSSAGRAAR